MRKLLRNSTEDITKYVEKSVCQGKYNYNALISFKFKFIMNTNGNGNSLHKWKCKYFNKLVSV